MVTMVYDGARAFRTWSEAIAYAYAPPVPGKVRARRRQVSKSDSGRWVVQGSWAPSRYRRRLVDDGSRSTGPAGQLQRRSS